MGIYNQGFSFGFGFGDSKRIWQIIAAIIAILVIAAAGFFIFNAAQPPALSFSFSKNPVKSDGPVAESTNVTITITNTTESDAINVPVNLRAKEASEFDISTSEGRATVTLPSLSKGTSRKITFTVNPIGGILPGTYVLVARTTINGEEFEKEAVLTVQG